jgi:hypothetical protein
MNIRKYKCITRLQVKKSHALLTPEFGGKINQKHSGLAPIWWKEGVNVFFKTQTARNELAT